MRRRARSISQHRFAEAEPELFPAAAVDPLEAERTRFSADRRHRFTLFRNLKLRDAARAPRANSAVRFVGFPVWVCECRSVRLRTRFGARKRADLLRSDLRVRTGKLWVSRPAVASRLDAWRAAT